MNNAIHKNVILFVSMGCSKNLTDTERLFYKLAGRGYTCFFDTYKKKPDIVIINTCGFINDAKEESINAILYWGKKKLEGEIVRLYVMGCLSQISKNELKANIPEVDAWFGKFDYDNLIDILPSVHGTQNCQNEEKWKRVLSTPGHYAYVKISEGCNRLCSFCSIPLIVGKLHSRDEVEILEEVKWLTAKGVKEINLVAQDICSYGIDIAEHSVLPQLVDKIAHIKGIEWLRLHYAYPANFPKELLRVMADNRNICRYIDIPFQHNADHILKSMRRGITCEEQDELIASIRASIPDIAIRTTLMVGYPSETDEDFNSLLHWVEKNQFEHLGVFVYSHEERTYAYTHYEDAIPQTIKQERFDRIMALQENISNHLLSKKIGQTLRVIIDRKEGEYYIGRSEWDSPEVDNEVLIKAEERLRTGNFYNVNVTGSMSYDLYGTVKKINKNDNR